MHGTWSGPVIHLASSLISPVVVPESSLPREWKGTQTAMDPRVPACGVLTVLVLFTKLHTFHMFPTMINGVDDRFLKPFTVIMQKVYRIACSQIIYKFFKIYIYTPWR